METDKPLIRIEILSTGDEEVDAISLAIKALDICPDYESAKRVVYYLAERYRLKVNQ